jgi:hypothetical protein
MDDGAVVPIARWRVVVRYHTEGRDSAVLVDHFVEKLDDLFDQILRIVNDLFERGTIVSIEVSRIDPIEVLTSECRAPLRQPRL